MVSLKSFDPEFGITGDEAWRKRQSRPARPSATRRYLVTLTSDEERVSHEVEWSPETAAAVSALAKDINKQTTWSASPRMHITPLDSPTGDVA